MAAEWLAEAAAGIGGAALGGIASLWRASAVIDDRVAALKETTKDHQIKLDKNIEDTKEIRVRLSDVSERLEAHILDNRETHRESQNQFAEAVKRLNDAAADLRALTREQAATNAYTLRCSTASTSGKTSNASRSMR